MSQFVCVFMHMCCICEFVCMSLGIFLIVCVCVMQRASWSGCRRTVRAWGGSVRLWGQRESSWLINSRKRRSACRVRAAPCAQRRNSYWRNNSSWRKSWTGLSLVVSATANLKVKCVISVPLEAPNVIANCFQTNSHPKLTLLVESVLLCHGAERDHFYNVYTSQES